MGVKVNLKYVLALLAVVSLMPSLFFFVNVDLSTTTPITRSTQARTRGTQHTLAPVPKQAPLKPLHLVYNVGCEGNSNYEWMSLVGLVLDYSWYQVRQRGKLTRLVSGCLHDLHKQAIMNKSSIPQLEQYSIQYVPLSERLEGGSLYVMFNRPNALLEFFKGVPDKDTKGEYIVYGVMGK